MRLAIVGSRDFARLFDVREFVRRLPRRWEVVSGDGRGVDRAAEQEARWLGMKVTSFPADWERFGDSAGPRRNSLIATSCDALVAFWDGKSHGTADVMGKARRAGAEVYVVYRLCEHAGCHFDARHEPAQPHGQIPERGHRSRK